MLALTGRQLRAIVEIIEDFHKALAIRTVGTSFFAKREVDRLVRKNLVSRETAENYPRLAYLFGRVVAKIGEEAAKALSFKDFIDYLRRNPMKEERVHKATVAHASRKLDGLTRSLGHEIEKAVRQAVIRADHKMKEIIQEDVEHRINLGVERGETVREVVRSIQDLTGDFNRNWFRIVATETNNILIEGQAAEMLKSTQKGDDEQVFKRPRPDACDWCKKHYLLSDGVTPRVFRLGDLRKAGDNHGLLKADWKPVLGSMHPHCYCGLQRLPEGFGFDAEGKMIYLLGPKLTPTKKKSLTKADVLDALNRSAQGANELHTLLKQVFTLPAASRNLVLD